MTLKEWSELSTVVAAIATFLSVIFAVYTYKEKSRNDIFKTVRNMMINFRFQFKEVNEMLNTSYSLELGVRVADELEQLISKSHTKSTIVQFLKNEENNRYINHSLELAMAKTDSLALASQTTKNLKLMSTSEQDLFPITARVLSIFSLYPASVLHVVSATDHLSEIITNKEAIEALRDITLKEGDESLLFRDVAIWVTYLSDKLSESMVDPMSVYSTPIVEVITNLFEKSSDRKLMAISRAEKKNSRAIFEKSLALTNGETAGLNSVFELLKFYKPFLESSQWDVIVENKALLSTTSIHN